MGRDCQSIQAEAKEATKRIGQLDVLAERIAQNGADLKVIRAEIEGLRAKVGEGEKADWPGIKATLNSLEARLIALEKTTKGS